MYTCKFFFEIFPVSENWDPVFFSRSFSFRKCSLPEFRNNYSLFCIKEYQTSFTEDVSRQSVAYLVSQVGDGISLRLAVYFTTEVRLFGSVEKDQCFVFLLLCDFLLSQAHNESIKPAPVLRPSVKFVSWNRTTK